jgi:RNA polymerase sigma-70 factor (ECF subfamily)
VGNDAKISDVVHNAAKVAIFFFLHLPLGLVHKKVDVKSDTLLVLNIKSGNSDAFAELFGKEFRNIKSFAYHYLNNWEQAEDIAQDTFLALWINRESISDNSNLKALLLTIAKNKALNILRVQSRFKKTSLEKNETLLNIRALSSNYMESQIDAIALASIIEQVHRGLPEHIRTSFDLSRVENLTYEEIAKVKGITVKSVEYHLSTALSHFREKLDHLACSHALFLLFFGVFYCFVVITNIKWHQYG